MLQILRKLKHENIIEMLDSFETPQEFCVVTEFAQVISSSLSLSLSLLCFVLTHANSFHAYLCSRKNVSEMHPNTKYAWLF